MATDYKYPDSTPVDEPVAPMAKPKAQKPAKAPKPKPVQYPDSVPVDEPVTPVKGYKRGGSVKSGIDGVAQRGKTRGRVC